MNYKLKIHPCFILFALVLLLLGKGLFLVNALAAVALHEAGHAYSLRLRGYSVNKLSLMPYGATVYSDASILRADGVAIAIAGPLANFAAAAVVTAAWWLFPSTYAYTAVMCKANLAIALFNLLPFYPLDASRVVLAVAGYKPNVLKALRAAGFFGAACFAILWIVSLFYSANHTLITVSAMLAVGAAGGIKKEDANMLIKRTGLIKNYKNAVEEKTLLIDSSVVLKKLLRSLSEDTKLTFIAVDDAGRETAKFSEQDLLTWAAKYGADRPLNRCISKK